MGYEMVRTAPQPKTTFSLALPERETALAPSPSAVAQSRRSTCSFSEASWRLFAVAWRIIKQFAQKAEAAEKTASQALQENLKTRRTVEILAQKLHSTEETIKEGVQRVEQLESTVEQQGDQISSLTQENRLLKRGQHTDQERMAAQEARLDLVERQSAHNRARADAAEQERRQIEQENLQLGQEREAAEQRVNLLQRTRQIENLERQIADLQKEQKKKGHIRKGILGGGAASSIAIPALIGILAGGPIGLAIGLSAGALLAAGGTPLANKLLFKKKEVPIQEQIAGLKRQLSDLRHRVD